MCLEAHLTIIFVIIERLGLPELPVRVTMTHSDNPPRKNVNIYIIDTGTPRRNLLSRDVKASPVQMAIVGAGSSNT